MTVSVFVLSTLVSIPSHLLFSVGYQGWHFQSVFSRPADFQRGFSQWQELAAN